jgi:hypothetical protein
MTHTQITQRIAPFERVVKANAKEITAIGNASWNPIKETTETPTIRAFLTKKGAGVVEEEQEVNVVVIEG